MLPQLLNTNRFGPDLALLCLLLIAPASWAQEAASTNPNPGDDVTKLSPFEVTASKDYGYRKQSSITTSRIGASILTIPQNVEIISSELMHDLSIADANQVFRYSSSVTVGEGEAVQGGIFTMRGFELPRYINGVGLATAFAEAPILPSDNLDRVEIAKGPVGLFYGNSTPNGVANYITKRPEFTNATTLEVSAGSYGYSKGIVDTQSVLNKKLGLAYRIIASASNSDQRVDDQGRDYTFVAPSLRLRPNKIIEVSAEVDYQKAHNPYLSNASVWNMATNPLYFSDLNNPNAQLLAYAKKSLGATDDASARSILKSRWTATGPLATNLTTWSNDRLAGVGEQPFLYTGSHIPYNTFSPRGDRFTPASPESNLNQSTTSADVGVTIAPTEDISFKYRWLHQDTRGGFVRDVYQANSAFLPNGVLDSLNATTLTIAERSAVSNTQQFDGYFQKEIYQVKNEFIIGAEIRRSLAVQTAAPIDYTKVPSRVDKNGNTLTGIQVYQFYDPFSQSPPPLYTVQGGATSGGAPTIAKGKDEEYYASWRASAFSDKLNTLAGVRHINDVPTRRSDNTYTIGAIYEALPGLSFFASKSSTVIITNTTDVISFGGAPLHPGEGKLLDNETGKGLEVGLKSSWHDNLLSGTISYYNVERAGVVTANAERNLTDPRNLDLDPTNDVRFQLNGGLQRVKGFDADLIWTPNRNLQILFNFENEFEAKIVSDPAVDTSHRTRTYIKEFERPLQKSPKFKSNVVAKYSFIDGFFRDLSVGTAVRYTDTYSVTNSTTVDIWVPTETLVDLFASYRTKLFTMPTEFQINGMNIFNQINDITRGNGLELRVSAKLYF